MTNIREILRTLPKGVKLYHKTFKNVTFESFNEENGNVILRTERGDNIYEPNFNEYLFPAFGNTNWKNWQSKIMPQCIGKVIVDRAGNLYLVTEDYLYPTNPFKETDNVIRWHKFDYTNADFANDNQTEIYFSLLRDNGYEWNEEYKHIKAIPTTPVKKTKSNVLENLLKNIDYDELEETRFRMIVESKLNDIETKLNAILKVLELD